jgi:cytochrome c
VKLSRWLQAAGLAIAGSCAAGAATAEGHGDAKAGEQSFLLCGACHSTAPGAPAVIGPNLRGVVGRPVASAAGYDYSEALRAAGGTWDRDRIDRFVTDPTAFAPGTKMGMAGIADPAERANLVAYLETLDAEGGSAPAAASQDFGPGWPAGTGQAETGTQCNACHSLAIVKQQRLSRERWDKLLVWMVAEQGMPEPSVELRDLMLGYLAQHFGRPE